MVQPAHAEYNVEGLFGIVVEGIDITDAKFRRDFSVAPQNSRQELSAPDTLRVKFDADDLASSGECAFNRERSIRTEQIQNTFPWDYFLNPGQHEIPLHLVVDIEHAGLLASWRKRVCETHLREPRIGRYVRHREGLVRRQRKR